MRMKLYELIIERPDETVSGYIVAPTEKQAVVMVIDHDLALGKTHLGFSLERIDQKVPDERRKGLDDILKARIAGFARYIEQVGWLVDCIADERLSLFKVLTPDDQETYVVAADDDEAAAIYVCTHPAARNERQVIRIADALGDLAPEQREGLASVLEFGPRGIAAFDRDRGWEVQK